MNNVSIKIFRDGKLLKEHQGHNVWVRDGLTRFSNLLALSSYDPDVPVETLRIKYMGFGIGGVKQGLPSADAPPLSTYYPSGSNTPPSTGHEYNPEFPIEPLIRSLERPVVLIPGVGPSPAYGSPNDTWLVKPIVSFPSTDSVEFMVPLDINNSTLLGGGLFTEIPLSEMGLFFSDSEFIEPFNTGSLAAYHAFDTLSLTDGLYIEFSWRVML